MAQEDVRVMEELLEAGQAGDTERLKELTHEECVIREPESLPYENEYRGETAIPDIHVDIAEVWDDFEFDKGEIFDCGDRIFTYFQVEATAPSGETVEMPLIEVYQLEDGKIFDVEIFYQDTGAFLEALGKVPQ
jgi:ketosteroid isomerase-like protein